MNEINLAYLNPVKHRFLPLPRNATEELEHEAKISDFTILKELGNGSYGKVYYVSHKKTKAKFAIKAIDKLNIENKYEKSYFNREVEIMYKLDHPNLSKLYGHFEDEKYCYLVMQYIQNGSAYNLLPKKGSKPNLSLIASIIRDVIRAVYYLHNMIPIVIHRDIKPENVLLDEENNAYLTDFGWSNYIINNRRRNTICGTPLYYSPEMVGDIPYDERVDIWSIGILLFELSTGKIPFEGDNEDTVKENISKLKISWPYNIDNDVKDLCNKILKTNPNQRLKLENILEHKFFKKYLNDLEQKPLIKPQKNLKNKIFIFNKDIPQIPEKKNFIEINDKRHFNSQQISKEKNRIFNNKNNTDSKANLIKKAVKFNINDNKFENEENKCNSNYTNKIKVEKKLINTSKNIKSEKSLPKYNFYENSFENNLRFNKNNGYYNSSRNLPYYHDPFNSPEDTNKNISEKEIKKPNNLRIYSSSFVDNNRIGENKITIPKYCVTHVNSQCKDIKSEINKNLDNKIYFGKNMNKYNTINIQNNIRINRRKGLESIKKENKDKDVKIIQVKNNLNKNHSYYKNINNKYYIYSSNNNNYNKKDLKKNNNNCKYTDRRNPKNHFYINDILKKKETHNKKYNENIRIKNEKDKDKNYNTIINKFNKNLTLQLKENNVMRYMYNRTDNNFVY